VFARAGGLMGVGFDSERLETVGQPVSLVSGVSVDSLWAQVHAAVSHSGVIAYVPGGDRAVGRPGWVNSTGATEYIDAPPARYGVFDLTRDGKRLAMIVADVRDYIWVYHLERGDGSRIAGVTSRDRPVWSPDGLSLAFASFDGMRSKFMVQRVDGGEARELPVAESVVPDAWSPDGSTVAYSAGRLGIGSPRRELGFVSMDGDARTPGLEGLWTSFSPDGKWFAYNSPTMDEIWVASYPDATVRRRITDAGKEPVWCACGELFYRWGNRWYATTLSLGAEVHWSPPRVAFETDFIDTPGVSYRVSPDGKRLLVVKRTEPDTRDRLHVLTAWWRLMGG
jgi:Tol biopolymer transport system component